MAGAWGGVSLSLQQRVVDEQLLGRANVGSGGSGGREACGSEERRNAHCIVQLEQHQPTSPPRAAAPPAATNPNPL